MVKADKDHGNLKSRKEKQGSKRRIISLLTSSSQTHRLSKSGETLWSAALYLSQRKWNLTTMFSAFDEIIATRVYTRSKTASVARRWKYGKSSMNQI